MPFLEAGKLDRRVRLQVETSAALPAEGSSGEATTSWNDLATVWAQKQPLRVSETYQAQQRVAGVDVIFRIRWRSDVPPDHCRVIDEDGRAFDILGVQEIGRREGLELLARGRGEADAQAEA